MEWISVNERLPKPVPADEGRNHECDVLIYVEWTGSKQGMSRISLPNFYAKNLVPLKRKSFETLILRATGRFGIGLIGGNLK